MGFFKPDGGYTSPKPVLQPPPPTETAEPAAPAPTLTQPPTNDLGLAIPVTGAPAPTTPRSLSEDPAYLAYLNALGFQRSEAERVAATKTAALKDRAAFTAPRIQEEGVRADEGVRQNYEDRGLLQSGARLRDQARTSADTQYRLGSLELGLQEDIGDVEAQLAAQRAGLATDEVTKALDVATSLYLRNAIGA